MRFSLILSTALLAACGIPGSTPMLDLTEKQGKLVCDNVDFDGVDQVETCDNGATFPPDGEAGTVTLAASTYDDCINYFTAVRTIQNPDCTGDFQNWRDCKSEDDWDNATVCGVYAGEMEAPVSDDCKAAAICATPVSTE